MAGAGPARSARTHPAVADEAWVGRQPEVTRMTRATEATRVTRMTRMT